MPQAAPILTAGTTVLGFLNSAKQAAAADDQRRAAATAAEQGQALSNESAQLQIDWAKVMQEFAENAIDAGYGDPDSEIRAAKDQLALDRDNSLGSAIGALKAAGAKPGDSALTETAGNIGNAYNQQWAQIYNNIRRTAPAAGLQLLAAADPGTLFRGGQTAIGGGQLGLDAGLGLANSTPQMNPSAFLAALMPYISQWTGGRQEPPPAETNYLSNDPYGILGKSA